MSKTALLFAGQGAQVVGMGRDFAETLPPAREWFNRANTTLGYDLASICFNGPGQLVISGEAGKIEKAVDLAKAKGAQRAIPPPVARAYHSPLISGAQPKLRAELDKVEIQSPTVPVVSNVSARPHESPDQIKAHMVSRVTSGPVPSPPITALLRVVM